MPDEIAGTSSAPAPAPTQAPAAAPSPAPIPAQVGPTAGFRPPVGTNPLLAMEAPTGPAPAPEATPAPAPAPAVAVAPTAAPAPAPAPAEPQALDFGGRVVELPADNPALAEALRRVHQDYQLQRGTLTRTQQQMAQLRGLAGEYQPNPYPPAQPAPGAYPQGVQGPGNYLPYGAGPGQAPVPYQGPPGYQTGQAPAAAPEAAPEGNADEFLDRWYQSPQELLRAEVQRVVSEMGIAPYVQQQQEREAFEGELSRMASAPQYFPDLEAMQPLMAEVLQLNPQVLDMPNPMMQLYRLARGYWAGGGQGNPAPAAPVVPQAAPAAAPPAAPAPAAPNVAALLSDPNIGPALTQAVLSQYAAQLQSGQPPASVGAIPGGVPPAAPPAKPANMKEATRGWLSALTGR